MSLTNIFVSFERLTVVVKSQQNKKRIQVCVFFHSTLYPLNCNSFLEPIFKTASLSYGIDFSRNIEWL